MIAIKYRLLHRVAVVPVCDKCAQAPDVDISGEVSIDELNPRDCEERYTCDACGRYIDTDEVDDANPPRYHRYPGRCCR